MTRHVRSPGRCAETIYRVSLPPGKRSVKTARFLSDSHFWDWNDELAATFSVLLLLFENLVGEIPGEQQTVVRLIFYKMVRRADTQVRARRVVPLFNRTSINDIIDQVFANAKIVQQRAAFSRRSINSDATIFCFKSAQQIEKLLAQSINPLAKSCVEPSVVHPFRFFTQQLKNSL